MKTEIAQNRMVHEVIRNKALQDFILSTLNSSGELEAELTLYDPDPVFLNVHGTPLQGLSESGVGALIVWHDITRLKRLEQIRSEFVANVSHELKTPVTTIKGFVETLLDGSVGEADTVRFLKIVKKHVESLSAVIEDLLSLSRIEQENEQGICALVEGEVRPVLEEAKSVCAGLAEAREMELSVSCPPELRAQINPSLLVHAVSNLVDNAIKYSEQNREIRIEAEVVDSEIQIRVMDQGFGIPADQIPRLFERFYRIDKTRSRDLGGTGLGLAIVKHIAKSHKGRVSVKSEWREGSTFMIHLPL